MSEMSLRWSFSCSFGVAAGGVARFGTPVAQPAMSMGFAGRIFGLPLGGADKEDMEQGWAEDGENIEHPDTGGSLHTQGTWIIMG